MSTPLNTRQLFSTSYASLGDPFMDLATIMQPENWRDMLRLCEHVYTRFGAYNSAVNRVISHFLTDVEFNNVDTEEAAKWKKAITKTFKLLTSSRELLNDLFCYGNGFASVIVPFVRWLSCPTPRCGHSAPLREVYENSHYKFEWQLPKFMATCPKCKQRNKFIVEDREDDKESKLKIKRWSPHEILIDYSEFTDNAEYYWRIPEDYKQRIRRKNYFHLSQEPMPVINAIAEDKMFRFDSDMIYHFKEGPLAGLKTRGWGFPRMIFHFSEIVNTQMLRRGMETILSEFLVPWRVITPAPNGGTSQFGVPSDVLSNVSGVDFKAVINMLVAQRRRDPSQIATAPIPLNYQTFGADAKSIVPVELLEHSYATFMNSFGTPVELYNGTMQYQAAPVALRLFESNWQHIVLLVENFLNWAVRQISQELSWESVDVRLKRITIADDVEKQMLLAQLVMAGRVGESVLLEQLGLDLKQQTNLLSEETRIKMKAQSELQEKLDAEGFGRQVGQGALPAGAPPGMMPGMPPGAPLGAAPPAGGAPAAGGAPPAGGGPIPAGAPQGPVSAFLASPDAGTQLGVDDVDAIATQLADQLLTQPDVIRNSELRLLKKHRAFLHTVVTGKLAERRREVRQSAGNAALAQMGGAPQQ